MRDIFIGSEALRAGRLTRAELRRCHTRILPDVYGPKGLPLTLRNRATASWLWSHREGVLAGQTAAALHSAKWVKDDAPIELIWPNHRSPAGVITYNDTLMPEECERVAGLPVTTTARTAFDLGRRGEIGDAVARLDALTRARPINSADVLAVAQRHRHVRGLHQVPRALDLMDGGAQSPKETELRLLLIGAGFPRPQTQIPVLSPTGYPKYYLDMGWPELMVSVEYDGDHHRTDRPQYARDIERSEYVARVGWLNIRVVVENRKVEVIRRVQAAWDLRRL